MALGINNSAAWRTPSQWRDRNEELDTKTVKRASQSFTREHIATEVAAIIPQKAQSMLSAAGAPTALILARLKQVLNAKPNRNRIVKPGNSKQHWMLSLLHGTSDIKDTCRLGSTEFDAPAPPTGLIMLLYETQGNYRQTILALKTGVILNLQSLCRVSQHIVFRCASLPPYNRESNRQLAAKHPAIAGTAL